jgi:hypothetical protein
LPVCKVLALPYRPCTVYHGVVKVEVWVCSPAPISNEETEERMG